MLPKGIICNVGDVVLCFVKIGFACMVRVGRLTNASLLLNEYHLSTYRCAALWSSSQ